MKAACAALAVSFLAACSSPVKVKHDPYPIDWPALAPARNGCPDLSGRFSNADSASGKVLLVRWALPTTRTPLEGISVVEVDGPRDKLVTLRFLEGPAGEGASYTERGRRHWKEGEDYLCENGWLVLSETKLIPLVAFVANQSGRFTRTSDGSLVVERREEGGGLILVIPSYLSVRNWFLYKQVDSR